MDSEDDLEDDMPVPLKFKSKDDSFINRNTTPIIKPSVDTLLPPSVENKTEVDGVTHNKVELGAETVTEIESVESEQDKTKTE